MPFIYGSKDILFLKSTEGWGSADECKQFLEGNVKGEQVNKVSASKQEWYKWCLLMWICCK